VFPALTSGSKSRMPKLSGPRFNRLTRLSPIVLGRIPLASCFEFERHEACQPGVGLIRLFFLGRFALLMDRNDCNGMSALSTLLHLVTIAAFHLPRHTCATASELHWLTAPNMRPAK